MNTNRISLILATLAATTFASNTFAEGVYVTVQAGKSFQASNNEPYGNNIAKDASFPGEFNAGNGGLGIIGVGYVINDNFRVEGRLGFRKAIFDSREIGTGSRAGEEYVLDGNLKSTTFTVEGFYDINTGTNFTPYLKAGLGVARNDYKAKLGGKGVAGFDKFDGKIDGYYDAYADKISTSFTWNIGLGASYSITKKLSVVGEYQFISLGSVETGQDSFTDGFQIDGATAHEISVGVRYEF